LRDVQRALASLSWYTHIMPLIERIHFKHADHVGGSLVVAEGEQTVPFAIRRTYFLHSVPPNHTRGLHAHKALTQVAVCARGSCLFRLDDGFETAELRLDSPNDGVLIRPMVWHEMSEFTSDCVFLVLASDHYDESDYIRSYEDFKRAVDR